MEWMNTALRSLIEQANRKVQVAIAPPAIDYSAVMAYMSDQNKTVALAQILASEQAMQQASMDRQLALAAGLEKALEALDVKLEMGKLQFMQEMTAEQNRHQEKLAAMNVDYQGMTAGPSSSVPDLPQPTPDLMDPSEVSESTRTAV